VEWVFTEVPNGFHEYPKNCRCLFISVEIFYFERRPINEDFRKKSSEMGIANFTYKHSVASNFEVDD